MDLSKESRDDAGFSVADRIYSITQEFKDSQWHIHRLARTWDQTQSMEYPLDLKAIETAYALLEEELHQAAVRYGVKA